MSRTAVVSRRRPRRPLVKVLLRRWVSIASIWEDENAPKRGAPGEEERSGMCAARPRSAPSLAPGERRDVRDEAEARHGGRIPGAPPGGHAGANVQQQGAFMSYTVIDAEQVEPSF